MWCSQSLNSAARGPPRYLFDRIISHPRLQLPLRRRVGVPVRQAQQHRPGHPGSNRGTDRVGSGWRDGTEDHSGPGTTVTRHCDRTASRSAN